MNVTIRCLCPKKGDDVRHPEGDTVVLRDRLDFKGAHAVRWALALAQRNSHVTEAEALAAISEQYVLAGVASWTVLTEGDKGKIVPLEPTAQNIHEVLLPDLESSFKVADAADDLFGAVMLPLLVGGSTSSQPTPTDGPTSPPKSGSGKHPKPSKPSSITTIPTAATEMTSSSLDGDSSLSPSSASAA